MTYTIIKNKTEQKQRQKQTNKAYINSIHDIRQLYDRMICLECTFVFIDRLDYCIDLIERRRGIARSVGGKKDNSRCVRDKCTIVSASTSPA